MRAAEVDDPRTAERAVAMLEQLIPIAVVVAAGCAPCAETAVQQALRLGTPEALVERTLGIVSHVSSLACLRQAVGPEAIGRMSNALEAGRKALRRPRGPSGSGACRG